MSKITLTEGFTPIPKGIHVFQITDVIYKEDYGKIEVTMETVNGRKHTERFSIKKSNGELNEGAINAFSFFAKTAMNDTELKEIEPADMVGRYMRCEVDHEYVESKNNPDRTLTFVRLGHKEPADGFDIPDNTPLPFDLNNILG